MACDLYALANEGVRGLAPYQPGKPIEELERELGLTDVVKLASNENPLGPGPRARAAIANCIDDLGRYPDGNGFALKAALAVHLGIAMDTITLGNGSNDVLDLVARVFVRPGQEVVFSQHAFAVYALVTQAVGAKAVVTPAREFGHDLEAMADAVGGGTRLVFIANPNNPTGTWVTQRDLKAFLHIMPEHVLVVVDEAYFEYVVEPEYPNCIPWVRQFQNLIVTRTFSKAYGLASLRVGYAISHPTVADLLNRVRHPFNVNGPGQAAAVAALQDSTHVTHSVAVNRVGMRQLEQGLKALGLDWISSVGNFLCVNVRRPGVPVYQALLQEGVIVRPLDNYDLSDFLRVTVGLEEENARFLGALERVLGGG